MGSFWGLMIRILFSVGKIVYRMQKKGQLYVISGHFWTKNVSVLTQRAIFG
jgi:hypothetical protein